MTRWTGRSPVEGEAAADRLLHACLVTDDAQYEAMIAIYDDTLTAGKALTTARDLESGDLVATATVIHTWDGRIELVETRELSAPQGALAGGLVGAALGVLFPGTVLAWAAGTAAWGALVGKLADEGIQSERLAELGNHLAPGMGALVTIGSPTGNDQVRARIPMSAQLIRRPLPHNAIEKITAADVDELPRFERSE